MNKRIIAFGCSYAFGHGLPDCIGKDTLSPGKYPSKYAYPSIISQKLDRQLINLSEPGSSNKEICYRILNFDFEKDDIVILSWSHTERSMIVQDEQNIKNQILGPWCSDKKSKLFYKHFYTTREDLFITELYYTWANYHLTNKVEKIINTPPLFNFSNNINLKKYEFIISDKSILELTIDAALDNAHPGVESHKTFAFYLLENFI
jgi:hypothetical protein